MSDTLQQETYTGSIRELGAVELSKAGKEKKRKVVVSDSPDYQGKTFRCWAGTPEWATLETAANSGQTVTIGFTPTPVEWGGKSWTENSVDWVNLEGASNPDDDWGDPAGQMQEPPQQVPAPQPQSSAPRQAAPNKDRLITVTAVAKSLIEGRYFDPANVSNLKDNVRHVLAVIDEVSAE